MTRIAIFQSRTGVDLVANRNALVEAIDEASRGGAAMLFTPEMTGLLDRDSKRAASGIVAEDEDVVLAACRVAALERKIWVHLGSIAVRANEGKIANRGFVIDDLGDIRARYDKIHLFDVDLPTGESWRESAVYAGGRAAVVVEGTPVGRLGLTICYDLRFPALFERLAEAGAEMIAVPAAFTVPTGSAHWEVLLRARAIESGLFIVAAAQSGRHDDGRETYGHSLVVDPWGQVLLDMGGGNRVGFADIELRQVADVRSRVPSLHHRKEIPRADVK